MGPGRAAGDLVRLRLAHITDLHITQGPRLADRAEVLDGILAQARELRVQATVLTGDLYGRVVPHRSTPAERAVLYPFVKGLAALGPVVVVYGNHDAPGDLATLEQLGGGFDWPVHVVDRARRLKLQTSGADLDVYALPWPTKRWLLAGEQRPPGAEVARQMAGEKLGQLLRLWGAWASRRRAEAVQVFAGHCMVAGSRISGGEVLSGIEIEVRRQDLEALAPDYGALGHIHMRQEVSGRCWYGGSPYRIDFGETDEKTWTVVDIGRCNTIPGVARDREYDAGASRVSFLHTGCRRFVTLDWRWAADRDDGDPRWIDRPDKNAIRDVAGAEVRARLVVPQQWVAGCPWEVELAALRAAGAHRVHSEPRIEPVHRVRAPEVALAETPRDKLLAYWTTLESPPEDQDRQAAEESLAELLTRSDEDITNDTEQMLAGGQS